MMGVEESARKPFTKRHKLTSQVTSSHTIPTSRFFITDWLHHRDVSSPCEVAEAPGFKDQR